MTHLDGNVLAGPAAGLFGMEITMMRGQCEACADVASLGEARVYGPPMGYIGRCRNCDNVLVVLVEHEGSRYVDMRGLRRIHLPVDATARG